MSTCIEQDRSIVAIDRDFDDGESNSTKTEIRLTTAYSNENNNVTSDVISDLLVTEDDDQIPNVNESEEDGDESVKYEEEKSDGGAKDTHTEKKCSFSKLRDIIKFNLILYFVLGVVSDLDLGYVQTPGFQKYLIGDSNFSAAPGSVCLMVGMLLGSLLPTFVLSKFVPGVRVIISLLIQFFGSILMWVLPQPFNNYFGTFFMYLGMVSTQVTILPLTYYESYATSFYIVGQLIATFVGSGLIKLFDVLKLGETEHMIVLLSFPIISGLCFFSLDRSKLIGKAEDKNHGDDDNEGSLHQRDIEDGNMISQHNNSQDKEGTSLQTIGSQQLSKKESLDAIKEIGFRYIPLFVTWGIFMELFTSSISSPSLQSSSLSYGGYSTQESILAGGDNVTFIGSIVTTVFLGVTIFSPLGNIISKMSPYYLWILVSIMVIITATALFGLFANAFPPMPIQVFYIVSITFSFCAAALNAFVPLFVGADKELTPKYKEFQIQFSLSIFMFVQLIIGVLALFWFSHHVLEECKTSYEQNYPGVSCDFFSS